MVKLLEQFYLWEKIFPSIEIPYYEVTVLNNPIQVEIVIFELFFNDRRESTELFHWKVFVCLEK